MPEDEGGERKESLAGSGASCSQLKFCTRTLHLIPPAPPLRVSLWDAKTGGSDDRRRVL